MHVAAVLAPSRAREAQAQNSGVVWQQTEFWEWLRSRRPLPPDILQRMATNLFVYGTLMRGDCRHGALAGQKFLGEAKTVPRYRMYDVGTYPALVESPDGLAIEGELWNVDDACLARLDDVEGVPEGLYARRPITLQAPFEETAAQAYFFLKSTSGMTDCGTRWHGRSRRTKWTGGPPPYS